MPLRQRHNVCVVCELQPSKYACASCRINYCSVACYSQHKETCTSNSTATASTPDTPASNAPPIDLSLQDPLPLRPLTSLQWPYVPDISAYPDPLTRDDPKPLQLHQYEALATSGAIRDLLKSNPRLCDRLTSLNAFRGQEREEALQRALGVDTRRLLENMNDASKPLDEDALLFREFAKAVEVAVRGGREDALGLDWDRADGRT